MTHDELNKLEELLAAATPGPWQVLRIDDALAMSAIGISVGSADSSAFEGGRSGDWPSEGLIAGTLVQTPNLIAHSDRRWQENAELIVALRNAAPELIQLARRTMDGGDD